MIPEDLRAEPQDGSRTDRARPTRQRAYISWLKLLDDGRPVTEVLILLSFQLEANVSCVYEKAYNYSISFSLLESSACL